MNRRIFTHRRWYEEDGLVAWGIMVAAIVVGMLLVLEWAGVVNRFDQERTARTTAAGTDCRHHKGE